MSIESTYKAAILEEALRVFLESGEIPTADQLIDAYDALVGDRDMTRPLLSDTDYTVTELEESSASKHNAFFDRTRKDLAVVYNELWDVTNHSMDSFGNWHSEMQWLENKLLDLESRVDNLLLLRQDTDGYFAFVEDNFVDFSKIDRSGTTANVDIINHTVTLASDIATFDPLNLNDIPADSAVFTLFTRDQIAAASDAPGTSMQRAIADVGSHWQYRVRTQNASRSMTGELKIKLGDSAVEISKIELSLHAANFNSRMIITAQYSLDDYNWYNLPTDGYVQSVDSRALFLFPSTGMKWVKFIMTKTGADGQDNNMYVYEFGADSIKFYGGSYNITGGGTLLSQVLTAYDTDDDSVPFNKLALQTCQLMPEDTSIRFWVQASNDTSITDWLRIDPYNISEPTVSTILDLGQLSKVEAANLVVVGKDDGTGTVSADSFAYASQYSRAAELSDIILVGDTNTTAYRLDSIIADVLLEPTIVFYRNIGPQYGSSTLVRGLPLGWREDGNFWITTIVVSSPSGITIDLGRSGAYLDGVAVTDQVQIPAGVHEFKTHKQNVAELSGSYYTEAELKLADRLYPYNHRKLIEGYQYPNGYTGAQRYLGVDLYCSHLCKRASIFDILNNTEGKYGFYGIDTLDGDLVFVVRIDKEDTDYTNEVFALSFNTSDNLFTHVQLKAELATDVASTTPVLTAYRIKLGV